MSNIGYAVFGRPKGMYSMSNGLIKELGLTSEFYLDNSHIILEKGQKVLMIKRYASQAIRDFQSPKKDTVLVALYEYALQHGENRPGAFIGSAICFKENMPNVDKIINGLIYLFSQIKKSVDQDNRFTMPDSSNWQVKLPDPNGNFGMFENQSLSFDNLLNPQDRTKEKTAVVKLNDFAKDISSLLSSFLLNKSFHYIEHLYASDSAPVVSTIQRNGFKAVAFSEFLDFTNLFNAYKHQIENQENERGLISDDIHKLKKELETLKASYEKEKRKVDSQAIELENLENKISELEEDLKKKKNHKRGKQSFQNQVPLKSSEAKTQADLNNLKQNINNWANTIEQYYGKTKDNESESIVNDYIDSIKERRNNGKRLKYFFFASSILAFIFLGLFLAFGVFNLYKNKGANEQNPQKSEHFSSDGIENKRLELIDKLYEIDFNKDLSDDELTNVRLILDHLKDNYTKGKFSPELSLIKKYNWIFISVQDDDYVKLEDIKSVKFGEFDASNSNRKTLNSEILYIQSLEDIETKLKNYKKGSNNTSKDEIYNQLEQYFKSIQDDSNSEAFTPYFIVIEILNPEYQ